MRANVQECCANRRQCACTGERTLRNGRDQESRPSAEEAALHGIHVSLKTQNCFEMVKQLLCINNNRSIEQLA